MDKSFLKTIKDNLPEPLKYLTVPFLRYNLTKSKEFLNYYRLLKNRETLSSEEISKYQFIKLKEILNFSYQNVPYYHELFNKISFDIRAL